MLSDEQTVRQRFQPAKSSWFSKIPGNGTQTDRLGSNGRVNFADAPRMESASTSFPYAGGGEVIAQNSKITVLLALWNEVLNRKMQGLAFARKRISASVTQRICASIFAMVFSPTSHPAREPRSVRIACVIPCWCRSFRIHPKNEMRSFNSLRQRPHSIGQMRGSLTANSDSKPSRRLGHKELSMKASPAHHMRTTLKMALYLCAVLAFVQIAAGQGNFQNLNFELASVPNVPPFPAVQVLASDALPGWTVYADVYLQTNVWLNGVSVGGALVSLVERRSPFSNNVIGGNFTVTLDSGTLFTNFPQGIIASAAIAQTGTIPSGMKSLVFDASRTVNMLQVTFADEILKFHALSSGDNFTRYGADVSGLAGLNGELRFTELPDIPNQIHNIVFLDNIDFSPVAIPEPGVLGLLGLGALFLGGRWFKSRR